MAFEVGDDPGRMDVSKSARFLLPPNSQAAAAATMAARREGETTRQRLERADMQQQNTHPLNLELLSCSRCLDIRDRSDHRAWSPDYRLDDSLTDGRSFVMPAQG